MYDGTANEKARINGWPVVIVVCVIVFLFLLSLTLYTFAHEGGHALLGLLFGGKITSFSINFFDISAHVGMDGKFTLFQQALISVAGVSLPILFSMAFLLLSSKKDDLILTYFKTLLFLMSISALMAWIAIPVLAMMGRPVGDDSFNFLKSTGIPPLLETGTALLVSIFGWVLFFRQMGGIRFFVNRIRPASIDLTTQEERKTILALVAVSAVIVGSAYAINLTIPNRTFAVPAGYQQVADVNLSKNRFTDQSVYRFTVGVPTRVGFYFLLNDVNGAPVTIRLSGSAGYEKVYLELTDPKATIGQASVAPQAAVFEKGDYQILVSLPQCKGRLKVYVKMGEK